MAVQYSPKTVRAGQSQYGSKERTPRRRRDVTHQGLGSEGRGKQRTVSAAAKRQPMTATASTVKGKRAGTARPGSSTAVSTR